MGSGMLDLDLAKWSVMYAESWKVHPLKLEHKV